MCAAFRFLDSKYKFCFLLPKEAFTLSGHCITECTGVGLPQSGIRIFASQLHTHLTGTRVITRHVRDGEELQPLNYDDHYSTHFQEIRLLPKPVTILPVRETK